MDELVKSFYAAKCELDKYKKSTEELNQEIKLKFTELGISEYEVDNLIASVTHSQRESFLEDKLIEKLKQLNAISAIKTVEVVDYSELENLIYNGKLDASELTACKNITEIQTLKVKLKKLNK